MWDGIWYMKCKNPIAMQNHTLPGCFASTCDGIIYAIEPPSKDWPESSAWYGAASPQEP